MIFDIDQRKGTAFVHTSGQQMSYKELTKFIIDVKKRNLERSVAIILSDNNIESITMFLALVETNVIPLMVGATIHPDLLQTYIETYFPHYIYVPKNKKDLFKDTKVILENGEYVFLETINKAYPLNNKLAFLLSTSGTTGSPKLVRHSKKNLIESANNMAKALRLTNEERALASLPLYFTQGLNVILSNLCVGATIFLSSLSLMDQRFWKFLKDWEITSISGVPFSYEVMIRLGLLKMELPNLKIINQGGGRLSDQMFGEIASYCKSRGKFFIPTYGSTETTSRMCFLTPELSEKKIGSIGSPVPNGRIELIGANRELIKEAYTNGELIYYGPNVTLGYAYNKDDLTKGDERNSRYATGDIAYFDEDGCYFIVGRKGRFAKIFGYRLGLDEIEKMIKDAFSISVACIERDQQISIYMDNKEGKIDSRDIIKYLSKKTGLVGTVFKVTALDEIPRNNYGKILYSELERLEKA